MRKTERAGEREGGNCAKEREDRERKKEYRKEMK